MAKFQFVEWLLLWLLEVLDFSFEWDDGNSTKSETKHNVTIAEIEQVFNLRLFAPLGVQVQPMHPEERLGLIGKTESGQLLMVSFTLRDGKVRPISARPAKEKERNYYEKFTREIT
jgi:uncharacterized DUF497 family protein